MATWRCLAQCGACCHLDPVDRPDLDQYLSPSELELYFSLVGEDGWCVHYDFTNRKCQIYEERPRFCRVTPKVFLDLYGVDSEEFNNFAIDCCHQQIDGVYGDNSQESTRFEQTVG